MSEFFLSQRIEHVRLIFRVIDCFFEKIAPTAAVIFDASVMSRGNAVISTLVCRIQKTAEFDIAVAVNAGVGGLACEVRLGETVDDFALKLLCETERIVRDAQPFANRFGGGRIIARTAHTGCCRGARRFI